MADMLETKVYGNPGSCNDAATALGKVRTVIDKAGDDVAAARRQGRDWEGRGGESFMSSTREDATNADELGKRVKALEDGLTNFAHALTKVQDRMTAARSKASGAGLTVSGTQIRLGDAPSGGDKAVVDAYNDKVKVWNQVVSDVDVARKNEDEAHDHLADSISKSTGDGFLENLLQKLGLLPGDFGDEWDFASYLTGLAGLAGGAVVGWQVSGKYGVFQPRVNGRFGTASGMNFWERLKAATKSDSWHAKAYQAGTRDAWESAGKWANRAGLAVTAATSFYDQWQDDADDPSLDDTARVTRATTKAATTTAGAWAGAEGGAWAGGAIGTAICPGVGTVIGGAVGGLVGGAIGAGAGGWVGDHLVDPAGEAADAAGDWIGDRAKDVGHLASDVGDALTFWD